MKFLKILSIVSFISLPNANLVVTSNKIKYKITHHNKCLKSDLILREFFKISLPQCVRECAVRSVCRSINYKRQHLFCELYSVEDGEFSFNNARSGSCVFVRKTSFDPQMPATCASCVDMDVCDVELKTCTRKECPKLILDKGVFFGNLQSVGSEVKFTCDETYSEVENRTHTTCEDTGEWSYVPRCIAAACSTTPFNGQYTNVALNKKVSLSTVLDLHPGHLMVDGSHDGTDLNCAHTLENRTSNYAVVDLEQSFTIHALYIVNRVDCCPERLNNVSISIGDSMDTLQLYVYHRPAIGSICTFVLAQPCRGRYLKIVNSKAVPLTICELEAYGVD